MLSFANLIPQSQHFVQLFCFQITLEPFGPSASLKNLRARTRWHLYLLLNANPSLRPLRKTVQARSIGDHNLRNLQQAAALPKNPKHGAAAADGEVSLEHVNALNRGEGMPEKSPLLSVSPVKFRV
jgi:hypothetical protein